MQYTIGVVLRVSFGFVILISLLAGCSTLMANKEQALRDHVARTHDSSAAQRVGRWLALRKRLQHQSSLTELYKVQLANDFFNAIPWRADLDHWQREDYWATPLETLLSNGGDCEDLAIAKYFTLLASGIEPDRLRLTYVWRLAPRQAHLVLAYFPPNGGEALILDNLNKSALALSQRNDLEAVYSFNEAKLWLAGDSLEPVKIASQDRLSQWRKVNQRMTEEVEQQYWVL